MDTLDVQAFEQLYNEYMGELTHLNSIYGKIKKQVWKERVMPVRQSINALWKSGLEHVDKMDKPQFQKYIEHMPPFYIITEPCEITQLAKCAELIMKYAIPFRNTYQYKYIQCLKMHSTYESPHVVIDILMQLGSDAIRLFQIPKLVETNNFVDVCNRTRNMKLIAFYLILFNAFGTSAIDQPMYSKCLLTKDMIEHMTKYYKTTLLDLKQHLQEYVSLNVKNRSHANDRVDCSSSFCFILDPSYGFCQILNSPNYIKHLDVLQLLEIHQYKTEAPDWYATSLYNTANCGEYYFYDRLYNSKNEWVPINKSQLVHIFGDPNQIAFTRSLIKFAFYTVLTNIQKDNTIPFEHKYGYSTTTLVHVLEEFNNIFYVGSYFTRRRVEPPIDVMEFVQYFVDLMSELGKRYTINIPGDVYASLLKLAETLKTYNDVPYKYLSMFFCLTPYTLFTANKWYVPAPITELKALMAPTQQLTRDKMPTSVVTPVVANSTTMVASNGTITATTGTTTLTNTNEQEPEPEAEPEWGESQPLLMEEIEMVPRTNTLKRRHVARHE